MNNEDERQSVILDEILKSETSVNTPRKVKKKKTARFTNDMRGKKKNCQPVRVSAVNQSMNSNMSYGMELEDCKGTQPRKYLKEFHPDEKFVELY